MQGLGADAWAARAASQQESETDLPHGRPKW